MPHKLRDKLIALAVAVTLLFGVLTVCLIREKHQKTERDQYIFEADAEGTLLTASMDFVHTYTPAEGDTLYFCLYPNAFSKEAYLEQVVEKDLFSTAYPRGFDPGYIQIESVSVNGEKASFRLEENEQILAVPLNKPNRQLRIGMRFRVKLPQTPMRFGYGQHTMNFGNWYPVFCPVEDGKPVKTRYMPYGDPFYSYCADYFMTLTASDTLRLASSGKIKSKEQVSLQKTRWTAEGSNMRDFAFVLSGEMQMRSQTVGNTTVFSYYCGNRAMGEAALTYAVKALQIFGELFGTYPYPTLSVVASDFYIGGMEYPGLVLIDLGLYRENDTASLEEVVVHETAHQWWYAVVGNNETQQPWLDEGLTQYSVALYYAHTGGEAMYDRFIRQNENNVRSLMRTRGLANDKTEQTIDRPLSAFSDRFAYNALVYSRTCLMLDALAQSVGRVRLTETLKEYRNAFAFSQATGADFLRVVEQACGSSASDFVRAWLNGKVFWG